MVRKLWLCAFACIVTIAAQAPQVASAADSNLDGLIARHAAANNVPEELIRRVIKRESGGNPRVISKGNYGLMQIKLPTARALGYSGTAAGLLDADTNMTYAVKYLAGAYRVARGNHGLAVHYYAAGYYYAAKGKGLFNRDGSATSALASGGGAFASATDTLPVSGKAAKRYVALTGQPGDVSWNH